MNAGGGAFTSSNGTAYAADVYFSGGLKLSTTAPIAGTVDDALYQNVRYAKNLSYNIPVGAGNYAVTLQFAEIFFTAPGKRVFDVTVEGKLVANDLDLVAQVGPKTAYDITVAATVGADGNLDIDLAASVSNAKINAIKVVPANGSNDAPTGLDLTPKSFDEEAFVQRHANGDRSGFKHVHIRNYERSDSGGPERARCSQSRVVSRY